jgi:ribosome biogenesis protein BMS1
MIRTDIPGCGDFYSHDISALPDPCPYPDKTKKRRTLNLVEKALYLNHLYFYL